MHDSVSHRRRRVATNHYDSLILFDSGFWKSVRPDPIGFVFHLLLLWLVPELMHFTRSLPVYDGDDAILIRKFYLPIMLADARLGILPCICLVKCGLKTKAHAINGVLAVSSDCIVYFTFPSCFALHTSQNFRNDDCCYGLAASHLPDINSVPATHQW